VVSRRELNTMYSVRNLIPYYQHIGTPGNMKKPICLLTNEFQHLLWHLDSKPISLLDNSKLQQHNKHLQENSETDHPENAGTVLTIGLLATSVNLCRGH
jgi:hypothetical protein